MPNEEKVTRKLRAILSADVKGYSLLMSDDEAFTVKTLKEYRALMSKRIEFHTGRVVDTPGDNLLAEFASIVDAVECAVEIQEILAERNRGLPEGKRLEFRIGVNIGDVIQDGDSLYGEGVNIAARIEGLAVAGGVCISRNAYDHIRNKLNYGYEYLGEHSVKNIKQPVRVYKLLMADEDAGKLIGDVPKPAARKWVWATAVLAVIVIASVVWQGYQKMTEPDFEPAKVEEMAYPLPDKPSIAVLPFDNMSGEPDQEFFIEGITVDIITALSKTNKLFVIDQDSMITYRDKPNSVKQVAEQLGVRYVLKGSVRKTEDRVRINAQLIDAISAHHLWAERYDSNIKDIFALQDEITIKIVTALQVSLTEGEHALMGIKRYKDLDTKMKAMEAVALWRGGTEESHMRNGQVAKELIDMAPESEIGYTTLGWHYWYLALMGKSPRESIAKAFKLAQKAHSLDESNPYPYALLGNLYPIVRQYDKGIAAAEQGVSLNPNGSHNHSALGITLYWSGKFDDAIDHFKQAIRLNPYPDYYWFMWLGYCYLHTGQYEDALTAAKKALYINPDSLSNHRLLAQIYTLLDRHEEASAEVNKTLEIYPALSIEGISKVLPYKNHADLKFQINTMRMAGFPE